MEYRKPYESNEILSSPSPLPGISSNETISLIQSALQPEIERRLEARRKMDKVAMETLIRFSDSHRRTSQVQHIPFPTNQHGLSPNKEHEPDEEVPK